VKSQPAERGPNEPRQEISAHNVHARNVGDVNWACGAQAGEAKLPKSHPANQIKDRFLGTSGPQIFLAGMDCMHAFGRFRRLKSSVQLFTSTVSLVPQCRAKEYMIGLVRTCDCSAVPVQLCPLNFLQLPGAQLAVARFATLEYFLVRLYCS